MKSRSVYLLRMHGSFRYAYVMSLDVPFKKKKLKYEDAFIKPINVDNNINKESNLHSNLSTLIFVDFFREIFERKQWR